jgi:hypothetical protein
MWLIESPIYMADILKTSGKIMVSRKDAKNAKENQDHYIGLIFAFVAPLRENKLDLNESDCQELE